MSVCSNLIAIVDRGNHQVVRFSHFSVKEYLTSERLATAERLSYYHTLPELHTILSHAGLSVLLEFGDKAERYTIGHFSLRPVFGRYWVDHREVTGRARLGSPRLSRDSRVATVDSRNDNEQTTLDYVAEIVRFLIEIGVPVSARDC
jgi:hypothetical protein